MLVELALSGLLVNEVVENTEVSIFSGSRSSEDKKILEDSFLLSRFSAI